MAKKASQPGLFETARRTATRARRAVQKRAQGARVAVRAYTRRFPTRRRGSK